MTCSATPQRRQLRRRRGLGRSDAPGSGGAASCPRLPSPPELPLVAGEPPSPTLASDGRCSTPRLELPRIKLPQLNLPLLKLPAASCQCPRPRAALRARAGRRPSTSQPCVPEGRADESGRAGGRSERPPVQNAFTPLACTGFVSAGHGAAPLAARCRRSESFSLSLSLSPLYFRRHAPDSDTRP